MSITFVPVTFISLIKLLINDFLSARVLLVNREYRSATFVFLFLINRTVPALWLHSRVGCISARLKKDLGSTLHLCQAIALVAVFFLFGLFPIG